MKKLLLPLGLMALSVNAFAGIETAKYDEANGLVCKNLFNISRSLNTEEWNATPAAEFNNKTRSMVGYGDNVIIAHSRTMVEGEDSNDYGHLLIYNRYTGAFVKQVQLTVNGEPLKGLLCANQIGIDDFGNYWLVGLTGDTSKSPFKIYHIKNVETGETELVAELTIPSDESDCYGRHDYYDIVGDVTGKQAGTVFMTPVANGSDCFVVGFERAQGSDEWGPHMDDGEYYSGTVEATYPAEQTTWNGAPMIRIIRDEDHSGTLYYLDAFVTNPTLYSTSGTMLESFASAPELAPKASPNGVAEFSMGDNDYLVYTLADYDGEKGSQVNVVKLGANAAFEGMSLCWTLPAEGLGTLTDTGSRMFGIVPLVTQDKNGKNGCYLTIYKCNNGLATYLISEPEFVSDLGAVNDITADEDLNAPVRYYN
ncbi:MAG: hypothetical protein K2K84_00195, partial [Muribaculaceae bacterium]|nr:hypothetical protein [Muribaculaceae bacterium]